MQRQRILVVEDNATTRKYVRATLAAEGACVVEAETGSQAIEALSHELDLVLLDLSLADMDGTEVLRQIRARMPQVPVIAFTGRSDADELRAIGFTDVIVKPADKRLITSMVRRYVRDDVTLALPRTTTHDRAWGAMTNIMTGLSDLALDSSTLHRTVCSLLEAVVDALGSLFGVAWSEQDGDFVPVAQIGISHLQATRILPACEQHPAFHEAVSTHTPVVAMPIDGTTRMFDDKHVASTTMIPLQYRGATIGMIALGFADPPKKDWLSLIKMISGPLAHSFTLAHTVSRLSTSEHKFRSIAETTTDGIVLARKDGTITYLNAAAERLLANAIGRRIGTLLPFLANGDTLGNIHHADGRTTPVEVSQRTFEDPPGVVNRVYVVRDLSHQVRLDELARMANHDVLTSLFNRRRFDEELAMRLATSIRHKTPGTILLLDLDHFKPINDTHGHEAGDLVLQAVAQVLLAHTRKSDIAARLGGDEFAMLLDHTDAAGAAICAERVLDGLRELAIPYGDAILRVGASIGIATFPDDGVTQARLMSTADAALYKAKRGGRGCVITPLRLSIPA